ncbi:MAG: leucine-rich repeat domain-containing protein [Saprospiraceae bacterium]|nr:leucine-rich repeat domain-containing protein [Saprospiraceae bacterium]
MKIKLILKTFLLPSLLVFGCFGKMAVAQTYHDARIETGQHFYELGLIAPAFNYFESAFHCPECDKTEALKRLASLGWRYLEDEEYGKPDGFMLQKLQAQLEERYLEFTPFDKSTGYLTAKKTDGKACLVDVSGQEYRFASRMEDLTPEVEALDLRQTPMGLLPPVLFKQTQLKILWVSGLQEVPEQLGALSNLEELQLSGNFKSLPASIGQLKKLKKLTVDAYKFQVLPPEIGELEALQQLSVASHELELPASIGRLGALRYLSILDFGAGVLPAELGGLKQLAFLIVSGYRMGRLPAQLGALNQLEFLYLNGAFESLPPEIGQLSRLRNLGISGKWLAALPEQIGQLTNLQHLRVAGTQLTNFPESIGNLRQLRYLEAHHNKLQQLPESLGRLSELVFIDVNSNPINRLPEGLGKLGNLSTLSVFSNELESVPESLSDLKRLTFLYLSYNRLKKLPQKLGQLPDLKYLAFNNNQIRLLPADLKGWSKLTWLRGENNLIESLPASIEHCKMLKNMILDDNQLARLPDQIGQLTNLEFLSLSNNQLTNLPESIGKLEKLEYLLLNYNQLKSLPQSLCDLNSTRRNVSFTANPDLVDIPACLRSYPLNKIKQLDWKGALYDRIRERPGLETLGALRDSLSAVLLDFEKKYKNGVPIALPPAQNWGSEKEIIEALRESVFLCDQAQVERYLETQDPAEKTAYFDRFMGLNDAYGLHSIALRLGERVTQASPPYPRGEKVDYLQKAALLYEKSMSLDSTITELPIIGLLYNSLGFNQLFLSDGAGAEASIRRGLTFEPDNHYLIANLPPALLLQGKLEAAEAQYRQWKGQRFGIYPNNNQDFRKVFLDDLKDLEAAGIVLRNVDYGTVRGWLE